MALNALAPDDRLLVALSAALGSRRGEAVEDALRALAGTGNALAVEEALVQSYLFLGYPAALNALSRWREISGRPAPEASRDRASWEERGAEVCRTVYGGQYQRLRSNIRSLHPDMERWMVNEGYGKVLGRPGLPLVTRELCIAALLAALDAPRQLYSHLRGALNAGASEAEISEAMDVAAAASDDDVRRRAREVWTSLRARAPQEG